MRYVMGVALAADSAAWACVDTSDGTVIADQVVPVEPDGIAAAAASSVHAFARDTVTGVDGIQIVWTTADNAAIANGIQLRTKLRSLGFDSVETVTEEAAREARNQTARYIAPDLELAYGAARADDNTEVTKAIRRFVGKTPAAAVDDDAPTASERARTALATVAGPMGSHVALAAIGVALAGLVAYTLVKSPAPPDQAPRTEIAEAVAPAPAPVKQPAPPPAVQAVSEVRPAAAPVVAPPPAPAPTLAAAPQPAPARTTASAVVPAPVSLPTVAVAAPLAPPTEDPLAPIDDALAGEEEAELDAETAAAEEAEAKSGQPAFSGGSGPSESETSKPPMPETPNLEQIRDFFDGLRGGQTDPGGSETPSGSDASDTP